MGTQSSKKRQAHKRQGQRGAKFSLTMPEDVASPVEAESEAKGVTKAVALLTFARDGIAARAANTAVAAPPQDTSPSAAH